MEENLSIRPEQGVSQDVPDAMRNGPEAMQNAFESEKEMLKFYLTMNRFINPLTYNMKRTELQRLQDLHDTLGMLAAFTGPVGTHQYDATGEIVKGFGLYMTHTEISLKARMEQSSIFARHIRFLFHVATNKTYAKRLTGTFGSYMHQINYLIKKMEAESADTLAPNIAEVE